MAQGFMSALFMGAKEEKVARKVIKVAAYFGFIKLALVLILLFAPIEFLQEALNNAGQAKLIYLVAGLITLTCLIFMLKGKFWAPMVLIALFLADFILTYIESQSMPGMLKLWEFIFYSSAAQAIYFLNKSKKESSVPVEL